MTTEPYDIWKDEKTVDEMTIKDLELLCECAFKLKTDIDELEERIEALKKPLEEYKKKIEVTLQTFGKDSWDSPFGKIEVRTKSSVKIPRDEESKKALFKWLEEKGIYDQVVSVNSMTLNSLYNNEKENAFLEGREVVIPGIGPATEYSQLILKGKK